MNPGQFRDPLGVDLTLHGLTPTELLDDVYFRPDYVRLHARPDKIDFLVRENFRHAAAVRPIPGTRFEDLETPHGYGGTSATDTSALVEGLAEWRERQRRAGRVAEFVRLHPFVNPMALRGLYDEITFNRTTVLVDLRQSSADRLKSYSKGTKHALKRGQRLLAIRDLGPDDANLFKECYEAGLKRNSAESAYFFPESYYRELLGAEWCAAWSAEKEGKPVAVACFLANNKLVHYHLAGGYPESRASGAHYVLLEHAFARFRDQGCRWMHLGGGRTGDPSDSLLRFKAKFSPLRAAYYIGCLVLDKNAYQELGGKRFGRFLGYRHPERTEISTHQESRLSLRTATKNDFPAFFRIKCDLENIAWTGHRAPPDWTTLAAWFNQHLAEGSSKEIYMAEVAGRTVGYAYADRHGNVIETSLAVEKSQTGKGWAREILRQLCRLLSRETEAPRIEAWIYPENIGSIRAHEAAGYRPVSDRGIRSVPAPGVPGTTHQACWVWQKEHGKIL